MKICVVETGAVGGLQGARFAQGAQGEPHAML
jgi:ketopantoate reductase